MKNWIVSVDVYQRGEVVGGGNYGPYEQAEAETISVQLRGWLESLELRKQKMSYEVIAYQTQALTFREIAGQLNDRSISNFFDEPVTIPGD